MKSGGTEALVDGDAGIDAVPRAVFRVDARVLAAREYETGLEATVSPVDLVLGWGEMARPSKAKQLAVEQRDRFYYWSYEPNATLRPGMVITNTANMHIVPETDAIATKLADIDPGDVVSMEGRLVDVVFHDGNRWETSLTRGDTGPGSCEIVLVSDISISARDT